MKLLQQWSKWRFENTLYHITNLKVKIYVRYTSHIYEIEGQKNLITNHTPKSLYKVILLLGLISPTFQKHNTNQPCPPPPPPPPLAGHFPSFSNIIILHTPCTHLKLNGQISIVFLSIDTDLGDYETHHGWLFAYCERVMCTCQHKQLCLACLWERKGFLSMEKQRTHS